MLSYSLVKFVDLSFMLCHRINLCELTRLQFISGIAQVIFLVMPPKFSELWFDLEGRTTATMVMSICMFALRLYCGLS